MSATFDRAAAEQDIKNVAAEASEHSSGTILNAPDPSSSYAHGKLERTGSLDEDTNMPTTKTTVSGAYAIGSTSAADSATNYDNKFTTPATETLGSGSRTLQVLPEQVQDLGTTVQTERTSYAVVREAEPVTYIPPTSNATYTEPQAVRTYTTTGSEQQYSSGGAVEEQKTSHANNVSQGHSSASRATDGSAQSGVPHSSASHSLAQDSTTTNNLSHGSTTGTGASAEESGTHKESMFSKLKHAFKK